MPAAKTNPDPQSDVLHGLTQIGRHVGYGPAAIKRWIENADFPARRLPDGSFISTAAAVTHWVLEARADE